MSERTLTSGTPATLADDIRDHGFAIVQTRVERVPARYRSAHCSDPDGCSRPTTLATMAVAVAVNESPNTLGLSFARDDAGDIILVPVCDDHRIEASHDLYYTLTGRERPDGIRAFDVPGQYMQWT